MGLLDCVASPEERDQFDETERPVTRPRNFSRSDHDISRRRSRPLFSSQTNLKNIRDVDFWRQRVLKFLFSAEGREDLRSTKLPLSQLGYSTVTDFIAEIPAEHYNEYISQPPPDDGILKDDKVFWVRDGIGEPGIFKWQGTLENEPCIGVQLDRKKAVPFGIHDGKGLFYCKPGHRAIVPEHEVIPYRKFLRTFVGVPVRKDSYGIGSIRLSAQAIQAKNAKPGDDVYLPKEKKWATVQWIGRIDNETVVDLIYKPPKPEAGKPISPDEPCFSRSMSMADFINEVGASEPNTPVKPQAPAAEAAPLASSPQKQPPPPAQVPLAPAPPPPPPPPPMVSDDSEQDESDEKSQTDDDTSEDDDDDDTESDAEHSHSDHDQREVKVEEVKPRISPPKETREFEKERDDDSDIVSSPHSPQPSPKLPSPKRKGFFKFTSNNKKRPKSPTYKVEEPPAVFKEETQRERSRSSSDESEPEIQTVAPKRSKSPNIFSNFKFKSNKKPKHHHYKVEHLHLEPTPKAPPSPKKKSTWGRIFKSKSKSNLEKFTLEEPRSPHECATPIDEMIPPDKIPTPPPSAKYNERLVERPEYLTQLSSSSIPETPDKIDPPNNKRNAERSPPRSPSPIPSPVKTLPAQDEKLRADVDLSRQDDDDTDTDNSESDEELEVPVQHMQTKVETHVVPVVDNNASNRQQSSSDSDTSSSEDDDEADEPKETPQSPVVEELKDPIPSPRHYPQKDESQEAHPAVALLEQFKESKVRNRPSSFGSFLARIKNQKHATPQPPTRDTPTSPDRDASSPDIVTRPVVASPTVEKPQVKKVMDKVEQEYPSNMGYKALSESESSLSSKEEEKLEVRNSGSPRVVVGINKSLVKPDYTVRKTNEQGNQEGIMLDLLEVKEQATFVNSPPPAASDESLKRSKNRSFSFNFSKKRKPSQPQTPTTQEPPHLTRTSDDEGSSNLENVDPFQDEHTPVKLRRDQEKERKHSKGSSFRDSFKRTFSLTRKKRTASESDHEQPMSPASTITKPRPVTLYIDNNEAIQKKNSFRGKRPTSVVVDIQPWGSRHRNSDDIYSSDNTPSSPKISPNPALLPKQPEVEIPKHRMFTTPSIFYKNKTKSEEGGLTPKSSNASLYKKWNPVEPPKTKKPLSPQTPKSTESTPVKEQPPPLPTAPPPVVGLKKGQSFSSERGSSPESQSTKLKSALKQRKEIDMIPKGLKVNDRVLWYSASGPIPGTVQRLFKDGTDKYTATVKFDREVVDQPLCLTREGDAYIITVEELITPDMFTPVYTNQQESTTPSPPQTPVTPSVRFDGVKPEEQLLSQVSVVVEGHDDTEEHDLPPPFQEEEVNMACGFRRGIQCRDKSCCLETILFSMFYTTNAFDITMLYGNTNQEDSVSRNARRILRREIVDPLRREGFCAWPAVKKLRDAVKPLSDEWQTLSTDAEVMMFILFDRALKLGKFLSYSNDLADYLHQLVVDAKDLSKSTTVQHLFENSLQLMDRLKLKTIPTPALILEMPRSKDKLVQYKAVIPNLSLHISHLLDNGPRLCICGVVAKFECARCSDHFGSNSIVYCDNCKGSADIIHFQLTHEADLVPLSQPIIILDLVAIICVKDSHYCSFVKCGNNTLSPWVFFDGADIENPKVCIEQNLSMWLERLERFPQKYHDALQYPLLTHILQDSHICIYQPREKSSTV